MPRHRLRAAGILLACASLSCGGGQKRKPDDGMAEQIVLRVWIDPEAGYPAAAVLEGCSEWSVKGIVCVVTEDLYLSHVQIRAKKGPCKRKDDGSYTLAAAYRGGRIVFQDACNRGHDGELRAVFRAVVTHEIGHQLGIWNHVPRACDGPKEKDEVLKVHPNGEKICGNAIMNPYLGWITSVTPVDRLAFDVRDKRIGVIAYGSGERPDPKEPDCIFTAKE